jgi:hypothetical protein
MARTLVAYAWASPNSLIGLVIAGSMILLGARARRAMTLGHVILGIDEAALEQSRSHEHVHVRQYEQWGPFFLPAYVLSSLWQLACGRRCYRDNWFERQAYERS